MSGLKANDIAKQVAARHDAKWYVYTVHDAWPCIRNEGPYSCAHVCVRPNGVTPKLTGATGDVECSDVANAWRPLRDLVIDLRACLEAGRLLDKPATIFDES
jgi:hypothetical protein